MKFVSISGTTDTLDAVTMRCLLSGSFQPETATESLSGSGYYRINEDNPYASYLARITDAVKSSGREAVYDTAVLPSLPPAKGKGRKKDGKEAPAISEPEMPIGGAALSDAFDAAEINSNDGSDSTEITPAEIKNIAVDKLKYFETLDAETGKLWSAKYLNLKFGHLPAEYSQDGLTPSGSDPFLVEYDRSVRKIEKVISVLHDEQVWLAAECDQLQAAIEQLRHFESLNIDVGELFSAKFLKLRFGRLPIDSVNEIDAYDKNPYVEFFRCSESNGYCWGMYVAPLSEVDEVDRIFAALFFERLRIPDITGKPADAIAKLTEEYHKSLQKAAELDKKINRFWDAEYESCMRVCSKLHRLSEAFNLRKAATREKDGYLLFGWVPDKEAKKLSGSLDELNGIELKVDNPEQVSRFDPPTKLKNPWISRPYEFFVSMFGMPQYNEFDPTPLVAVTYTLFYGIMFADLGQGILLALIGWFMGKYMHNKLGPILIRCGITGALFGTLFGSVFGYEHWLDGFYRMLGFNGKPIEVMDSSSINMILISAIGIGVLLMLVAILLNIYISLRKGEFGVALFGTNGIAGLVLYTGLLLLVLSLVITIPVPTNIIVWLMIVIPCLLIWMSEPLGNLVSHKRHWMPENWGEYLVQGIFEMFESVLSYMTNTVSFIRVGAFVLVHAGMMLVFSTVAEMAGGGVGGVIVMIFGNLLVTALEGLLVGVQSLRLEYYEMFSRFFTGSGKEFTPAGTASVKN
jgi:Archaeal/vacuolar-type H+-ATPase subunit I